MTINCSGRGRLTHFLLKSNVHLKWIDSDRVCKAFLVKLLARFYFSNFIFKSSSNSYINKQNNQENDI